jgi:hypothetical protein
LGLRWFFFVVVGFRTSIIRVYTQVIVYVCRSEHSTVGPSFFVLGYAQSSVHYSVCMRAMFASVSLCFFCTSELGFAVYIATGGLTTLGRDCLSLSCYSVKIRIVHSCYYSWFGDFNVLQTSLTCQIYSIPSTSASIHNHHQYQ